MPLSNAQKAELIAAVLHDPVESALLAYDWRGFNARENQVLPDGDWDTWMILAGRGFGKTRTGAETVREIIEAGNAGRVALIAPTAADARDTMVEGESGILAISPPWCRPRYEPSKRRLTWPNGAIATLFSAEEPDRLRGPQHDLGWCDEVCAWAYQQDTWDMYQFGLRLGAHPRTIVSTTPKPHKIIRQLVANPRTHVTRGSTFENRDNLANSFFQSVVALYQGTRLGRQELMAEILDDNPGALWSFGMIDPHRRPSNEVDVLLARCSRIVAAADPAVTANDDSAETGIIVAGLDSNGRDAYVFDDRSLRGTPYQWGKALVDAFHDYKADRIIGEVNNGGDLIESNIRQVDPDVPYTAVRASRGKTIRAEPIAALYEQGRVHHVGCFERLETQMVEFNPMDRSQASPDRMDALVWALTELFGQTIIEPSIRSL